MSSNPNNKALEEVVDAANEDNLTNLPFVTTKPEQQALEEVVDAVSKGTVESANMSNAIASQPSETGNRKLSNSFACM